MSGSRLLEINTTSAPKSTVAILSLIFLLAGFTISQATLLSLKSKLEKLVTKATQSWPKRGAYAVYTNGEFRPYKVYYYDNQIVSVVKVPGVNTSWVTATLAGDPEYFYRKFPNKTSKSKRLLKLNKG